MPTFIETRIEAVSAQLDRLATSTTDDLGDVATQIGALTTVCSSLLDIIAEQQRQIERLQDVLQNHLETEPRRR